MTPENGNIILIPKGTTVWLQPRYGAWRKTTSKQDHVAVVEWARSDERGTAVGWSVGGLDREAAVEDVQLLDAGNHRLTIGARKILGGHPIRGMGNVYGTSGSCTCGDEYVKRPNADDVRKHHRAHVLRLAKQARAMA